MSPITTKKFPSECNPRGVVKTTDKVLIYNSDTGASDEFSTVGELTKIQDDAIALKVDKTSVVNNLITSTSGYVLDARQGKTLSDLLALKAVQTINIIAGAGLTGGGTLTTDRTLNVATADDGLIVNADNVKLNIVNDLVTTSATRPISSTQAKNLYDSYFESLPTTYISSALTGDGTAYTTMVVYTIINVTATITGGTFSGGLTTLSITARTNTSVVFKLTSPEGIISIKGLTKIVSVTTLTNSPSINRAVSNILPSGMTYFVISGQNTVSGTLSIPSGMTLISISGQNTVSGTLSIPSGMTLIVITGKNTVSGTLSIPSGMTYFVISGQNTVSGVLSIPSGMTSFSLSGFNTVSGVLSIPSGMTSFFLDGQNTVSGTLSIPSGMTSFSISGQNTVSGTLSIPSGMTYFVISGQNTVSGTLSTGIACQYIHLAGCNTVTYSETSGTRIWPSIFRYFYIRPYTAGIWTSAMTDALCIDLDTNVTTASTEKLIDLKGNCGAPTSASLAARTSLIAKGFTVNVNS